MKKNTAAALILMNVTLMILLATANPAAAGVYGIRQLDTGMVSDDLFPAINNQGEIVWYHAACQFQTGDPPVTYTETGKYYFYQAGSLTALNVHPNYDPPYNYFHPPLPLFNDRGQIGYLIQDYKDGSQYKIFFHDGPGSAPQLASSTAALPNNLQLNQEGRMVWSNYDAGTIQQVYLFDNGQGAGSPITSYADSSGYTGFAGGLSLNDAGQVIWIERAWDAGTFAYVNHIRLYQGGTTRSIYSTPNVMYFTQINSQGRVAWLEQDHETGNGNIMLYDGNSAGPVPGGTGFLWGHVSPDLQINNQGQVMWLGNSPETDTRYNLFLHSDGATTQITHYTDAADVMIDVQENWDNARTRFSPRLNNHGEIVWATSTPNSANPYHLDLAVQVYSGGRIVELDRWTADPRMIANWGDHALHAVYAQINDAGQVVWSRYRGANVPNLQSDFEIYLATPVTLADAVRYLQVLTGAANGPLPGDVSGDRKIGVDDVMIYLQSAAGLR